LPADSCLCVDGKSLEEIAGLGKWEEGWKESIKAAHDHGMSLRKRLLLQACKTERPLQRRVKQIEKLLKVEI